LPQKLTRNAILEYCANINNSSNRRSLGQLVAIWRI
jgi:hypothetical protein